MADLKRLQTAVEVGDRETAVEVTQQAIDEEIPPKTVSASRTMRSTSPRCSSVPAR
jgi:hypothetical protein